MSARRDLPAHRALGLAAPRPSRRALLRHASGLAVGLPLMEAFTRRASAAAAPRYAAFVGDVNGVVQPTVYTGQQDSFMNHNEPDMFWPSAPGALTPKGLAADLAANRAVGELAAHANNLLVVRGINHPFTSDQEPHSGGANQLLTAARHLPAQGFAETMPSGISVDVRIARALNPGGRGPLTLAFHKASYAPTTRALSYEQSGRATPWETDPIKAYGRMLGATAETQQKLERLLAARRSVNDMLRAQVQALGRRGDLSRTDRLSLERHLQAIRDIEVRLDPLPPATVAEMEALSPNSRQNEYREKVAELHMDLIAFAFASDYTRTATLTVGESVYVVDGTTFPSYHWVSHRIQSDSFQGAPIEGAMLMHHQINRVQARRFLHLVDRLASYQTPFGRLLDLSAACWTNHVGAGNHLYQRIPWVIAGGAGGYLKQGVFVDLGGKGQPSNKLLNTLLNAVGVRSAAGAPVDDFGDASLPRGELPEIKAA